MTVFSGDTLSKREISLYVHVPFCRKKCDYCDFFSLGRNCASDFDALKQDYVRAVSKEVQFYAHHHTVSRWKTVYIGGGTPSQLSPEQIRSLMQGIFSAAPKSADAEVTIEVNPDDLTEELVSACAASGITRISMGVQAFDQKALNSVRRGASAESALRALDVLQKNWRGSLSCDLIAGLPNHTYASFENGIRMLSRFPCIDHISLYTLTVEDGTPLAKNIAAGKIRWSQEKADRMWIRGRNLLEKQGFFQYEVSNFSRSGCQSRHNMTYWKLQDYIGCGAGASGTLYGKRLCAERQTKFVSTETQTACSDVRAFCDAGIRWTNTNSVSAYNNFWLHYNPPADASLPRVTETLDAATQEFEFLMMGFRMLEGVGAAEYRSRFGGELSDRLGAKDGIFASWKKRGFARIEAVDKTDSRYALTRRGILLLNRFLEELL
ncbi:MAG: radical SAM family heme chaperone HemW [Treponema sp.]|nr:radical SAM family heme chaperone HemW [Treponema sp.]